jgi:SIT family siderophore-iron:H+ symporter-like MFS transporter
VLKIRHLKPFIVAGTTLSMVAFGIVMEYRGNTSSDSHADIIGEQICLGIAGGMFLYPAQASIQAATKHERTYTLQTIATPKLTSKEAMN